MRILVTGATGFLGRYLVPTLVESGHQVIAFGRNETIGKALEGEQVKFIKGDFTTYGVIHQAMKGVEAVAHCGALSTVWGNWESFYQVNVVGTENVLKACQANNVSRLVYLSSPSIYTGKEDRLNILENQVDTTNQLNHYIKSKIMAEALIKDYAHVDSVILRPRGLFGVGDTSIIPRLIKVNRKIGLPLFNQGANLVDMTCVENVAHAVTLSLSCQQGGGTYNITNGEPMPFKAILEQLFEQIGETPRYRSVSVGAAYGLASFLEGAHRLCRSEKEPIITRYTIATLAFSQTLAIDKAKEELGYQPIMSIEEGIRQYGKDYRKYSVL